uniref:GnRH-like hexadecapeptide n=1 Tax=Ciona intestinalis TaxID=7719 RepID=Q2AC14_CIOIN|nr:GnRH-like hexadecapeptide precursor [Ciona intestinalis]BAE80727.1 GnRH-like hexadecapeptide [Ciona intestinalis]BAH03532.1 GnRH-like hexadecapeptide [Ciona intestinalis]|eukprot:NP_001034971.1 GnRH-like hexadecapeptide precursor [Ciona intestinalis]
MHKISVCVLLVVLASIQSIEAQHWSNWWIPGAPGYNGGKRPLWKGKMEIRQNYRTTPRDHDVAEDSADEAFEHGDNSRDETAITMDDLLKKLAMIRQHEKDEQLLQRILEY